MVAHTLDAVEGLGMQTVAQPLRYEKHMLDKWFRERFAASTSP